MTNLFKNMTPYSEIKNTVMSAGLDNKTLAGLAKSGLHPNMSRMLAFNHGLNAKDIQDKVSEYSKKTVTSRDLLSKVYQDVLSNQSKEDVEKNEVKITALKGRTESMKSDSFEKFVYDYFLGSRFTVDDVAFHMVYGNQDWNLMKKDPEIALNYYDLFKDEIEDHFNGMRISEVTESLHALGCYPEVLNDKILKTRLFLKSKAHELSHAQVKELTKKKDKEIAGKYARSKSKEPAKNKRSRSTKRELEMA